MVLVRPLACLMTAAAILCGTPATSQDALEGFGAGSVDHKTIALDMASTARVPSGTATLIIGNPAIADAALPQSAVGLMVLTGKSYGMTNIMALDSRGRPLGETMVRVEQPSTPTVTVLRGTARETWICAPRCEQTWTLGDNPDFFGNSNGQIGTRNGTAGAR
jgi:Flp pilus assembly secretin CpaC